MGPGESHARPGPQEDACDAEKCSTSSGDQVEPRRRFIQTFARHAKNIDI
jgi:DNA gyrase/topoisomerase IV subunit B